MIEGDVSFQTGYRLLVRPRPMQDESCLGYLSRVANSNVLNSRELLDLMDRHTSFDQWHHLHQRVSLSISDTASLIGPLPQSWQVASVLRGIATSDFNHINTRWCPLCLQDKPYLRGEWGLKLTCVCVKHGCYLQERCMHCNQTQLWHQANVMQCSHCGTSLDHAVIKLATQEVIALQRAISAALGNKGAEIFPKLDTIAWLRLIRYFGQYADTKQPRRPGQIAGLHQLDVAMVCVQNVANLLAKWPNNFELLLQNIQGSYPATPSLKKTFGSLYRVLYFHLRDACFDFLRDAFEVYLHQHWWGMVCKRNRSFKMSTIAKHPRLTLKQVATKTGVEPALIRHLSAIESLNNQAMTLPSGRQVNSFHQADLPHIKVVANDVMNLQTTAKYLAVSERVVRELISVEIVKPMALRGTLKASCWLIPKSSLDGLFFDVIQANGRELVSLASIIRYWRLREGELVQLIQAIQKNALMIFSLSQHSVALGKVMLDKADAKSWLHQTRTKLSQSLSVGEVAKVLGIKQQVAYQLVNIGLIKSKQEKHVGRQVTEKALEVFNATYISLYSLAKAKQTSPSALLRKLGARPITGPQIDGGRQYFYLKKEIE